MARTCAGLTDPPEDVIGARALKLGLTKDSRKGRAPPTSKGLP
jgi:hypothetical protein